MTLLECASGAARLLTAAGMTADEAQRDVSVLARHLLGWTRADWLTRNRNDAPSGFDARLRTLAERRARHEPVAYLTGVREFYGRDFLVTPAVLIPRPETEGVIEEALTLLAGPAGPAEPAGPVLFDIGTGSGCLAITLALECPSARVVATDTSPDALDVARRNARALGADRVEFVETPLLPPGMPPDIIVSNPPYVPEADRATLPPDVRDFEPAAALFAGRDGLDVIRALIPAAARRLKPGGWLILEVGSGQADAVAALVRENGLALQGVREDLQGIPRIVVATQPAASLPATRDV